MEQRFENLRPSLYEGKSPVDFDYNCIAYAAGKTDKPWWPAKTGPYHWPRGLDREDLGRETLDNFIKAFKRLGYSKCTSVALEKGLEKVVIYVKGNDNPTHAARQIPSGAWVSKIGDEEDIEHTTPKVLEGKEYGKIGAILKRRSRKF